MRHRLEGLAITNIAHHHKNNLIAIIAAFAIIASYRANLDDKGAGEMHNSEIKGVMAIGAASVKSTVPGYMDIACPSMGNAVDSAEYLSKKFPLSIFSVFGPKGKCIAEFLNGEELTIQSIDR